MTQPCFICGHEEYYFTEVLWSELIQTWQLSENEINYINRQQGLCCKKCGSNLRTIALAKGILDSYGYQGLFTQFVVSPQASDLRVLEINEAGRLTPLLNKMTYHRLVHYPEFDMTRLDLDSNSYDLVVHSDTLEHVEDPLTGLSECKRVLSEDGRCIFTIPIITGRLTRSRAGLPNSYHGTSEKSGNAMIVHTEFGADFWQIVLQAGFASCTIHCLEYPAGLAIDARI
jgi:SAM-dependent methyltransferase